MVSVIISCREGLVVEYEEADELFIYDMDLKKVVFKCKKPRDQDVLEELIENYDVCAMITAGVAPENRLLFEEVGIKLVIVDKSRLDKIISDIFV